MRFLMLNWRDPGNPKSGGAERVTQGYLAYLARQGHEVFWFAPLFAGAKSLETVAGIQIVRQGEGIARAVLAARRWYRQQKPFDLVMDQHHGIPWYAPWWCKTHCVAYIHEVLGPIWNAFYRWPYNVIGRRQERWTHWLYRQVPFWTASTATRQSLRACGVRRVKIIPYGVATMALPELEPKPLTPPLRLAVVSRLAPNKRVDHIVRTLKLLGGQAVNARLLVVGRGEAEAQVRQCVADLELSDRVTFAGALPEPEKDRALRESHLLLHTSLREGWGLNVIEANAMGTPAVVYPVAGLVESTLHEQTGLVAKAETPEALAHSIQRLVAAPETYQRYRQQAWERSKTFHWDRVLPPACQWLEQQARGEGGADD